MRPSVAERPLLSERAGDAPPLPRTPASGRAHAATPGPRPDPSYGALTSSSSLPFVVSEKLLFHAFPQKHVVSNRRLTAHAASARLLETLGHGQSTRGSGADHRERRGQRPARPRVDGPRAPEGRTRPSCPVTAAPSTDGKQDRALQDRSGHSPARPPHGTWETKSLSSPSSRCSGRLAISSHSSRTP